VLNASNITLPDYHFLTFGGKQYTAHFRNTYAIPLLAYLTLYMDKSDVELECGNFTCVYFSMMGGWKLLLWLGH